MTARPTICLNMIVKNEVHIVAQVLDAVAPYISSWVIVDTGSDDGTQDLIRNHMDSLGIPGSFTNAHGATSVTTEPRRFPSPKAMPTTSGSWTPTTRSWAHLTSPG